MRRSARSYPGRPRDRALNARSQPAARCERFNDWGIRFAFAGPAGRIDGESGDWHFGKRLLAQLLREHRDEISPREPVERFVYPPLPDASHAQARLMELVPRAH